MSQTYRVVEIRAHHSALAQVALRELEAAERAKALAEGADVEAAPTPDEVLTEIEFRDKSNDVHWLWRRHETRLGRTLNHMPKPTVLEVPPAGAAGVRKKLKRVPLRLRTRLRDSAVNSIRNRLRLTPADLEPNETRLEREALNKSDGGNRAPSDSLWGSFGPPGHERPPTTAD